MQIWYMHNKERLPIMDDDEKAFIEDLTGCVPLLLNPLLEFGGKLFHDVEKAFLAHPDLVSVSAEILKRSRNVRMDLNSEGYSR